MKYNTGIYQIVNLVNGKRYIGSAVNLEQRRISHFNTLVMKIHKNRYFQRAYNKYGKDNFEFKILLYCAKENLLFYEQRAIDSFDFKKIYNISKTAGSNLGIKFTEEHKKKISDWHIGRKHSKKSREKMSISNKGRTRSKESIQKTADKLRGRERPIEVREKISKSLKGKKLSKEHVEKMAKSKRGRSLTPEHRNKISQTLTGRKLSEENKKNIGISNTKNFTENQLYEMKELRDGGCSYLEISKKFNVSKTTICKNLISKFNLKKTNIRHRLFSDVQIEEIKKLKNEGMSYGDISKKFKCSRSTISTKLKNYINGS